MGRLSTHHLGAVIIECAVEVGIPVLVALRASRLAVPPTQHALRLGRPVLRDLQRQCVEVRDRVPEVKSYHLGSFLTFGSYSHLANV